MKLPVEFFKANMIALTLLIANSSYAAITERVNVSSTGGQANFGGYGPKISADGRYVVFASFANNLVAGDTNGGEDVFIRDRQAAQTTLISVSSTGMQGNAIGSYRTEISGDGRYVAFSSDSDNLVARDTNGHPDIFVRDRQTAQTTRVSLSTTGGQANGPSDFPAMSADGRYVVFSSSADNLVSMDTNGTDDIFVRDRQSAQTTRVSVSSTGVQGNNWSATPAISADGRYVVFRSFAGNLVVGDTNGSTDIFVHDRQTAQTTRVSVNSTGDEANDHSYDPAISADGRYVAFSSSAKNLVAADSNLQDDVFLHDRQTSTTTRVSLSSAGGQANGSSGSPTISADGSFVVFHSNADNLVAGDTNGKDDIFLYDRQNKQTTRASVSSNGVQANGSSNDPAISADGRLVAFYSGADNLVAGDTNGNYDIFVYERVRVVPKNVVLLLHGMNSTPATWNTLVNQYFPKGCRVIYDGRTARYVNPNQQGTYCFRIKFGSFDLDSPNKGLEDAWEYGEENNYPSAGDYSTFNQLGTELDKAITAINRQLLASRVLLVAHDRGGLAARAFLQQPGTSTSKDSVVGLITTGTPHRGTRLGRLYGYIRNRLLGPNGTTRNTDRDSLRDWNVLSFLRNATSCNNIRNSDSLDLRRPTIGHLADNGSMVSDMNASGNLQNLPSIQYGQIAYGGVYLGKLLLSSVYNLFEEPRSTNTCAQLSRRAEAFIKGGTVAQPISSTRYPGDGTVTSDSQVVVLGRTVKRIAYRSDILHSQEPRQVVHIANMACELGFSWFSRCVATSKRTQSQHGQTAFASTDALSHDYAEWNALSAAKLWEDYSAALLDDFAANRREHLAVTLGIRLRDKNDPAFYVEVEQRLLNSNVPQIERARLARLLAEIATPSAAKILTDALVNPNCSGIQTALRNAILELADSLPEQPRRDDLSSVVESAWLVANQDPRQLQVLALALAKLGTPQGVQRLLSAVEKVGPFTSSANATLSHDQHRARAAFAAMDEIIHSDSEKVLSSALRSHRASEAVFIAAGTGLANLGRETAARLVLQHLDELPANAIPIAQNWLTTLSGKIDQTTLRSMNQTTGRPIQPVLRKYMEEIAQ